MSSYEFYAFGHPRITATHKATLEFTKEEEVTERGTCILGVSATFSLDGLTDVVCWGAMIVRMQINGEEARLTAHVNPSFSDTGEMVFRKSTFTSERTLGIRADMGAGDVPKTMVDAMTDPAKRMRVILERKVEE